MLFCFGVNGITASVHIKSRVNMGRERVNRTCFTWNIIAGYRFFLFHLANSV